MTAAAAMQIVPARGLLACGAESLAVRAGGLVFTGALGVAHGDGDAAPAIVARALAALGCGPDQVGRAKVLAADAASFDRLMAEGRAGLPAAALTRVGACLQARQGPCLIEATAVAEGRPDTVLDDDTVVAARLGPLVATAGCGPFDGRKLIGAGDLAMQGRHALERLREVLGRAGATTDDLVKVNNTTACWHDYRLYNAAYNAVLAGSNAARCSVSGALRHPLSLIEVEAVAAPGLARTYVDSTRSGVGRETFLTRADTLYLPELGPCKGPHSHGAKAGPFVFIAGECPYDSDDQLVGTGDIEAQTVATLRNVRLSLEALGATLGDVVKTSVTLSDIRLAPAFDRAYATIFAPPYPARSLVATPLGQYGILVEIEAIAVIGAARDGVAAVGAGS